MMHSVGKTWFQLNLVFPQTKYYMFYRHVNKELIKFKLVFAWIQKKWIQNPGSIKINTKPRVTIRRGFVFISIQTSVARKNMSDIPGKTCLIAISKKNRPSFGHWHAAWSVWSPNNITIIFIYLVHRKVHNIFNNPIHEVQQLKQCSRSTTSGQISLASCFPRNIEF